MGLGRGQARLRAPEPQGQPCFFPLKNSIGVYKPYPAQIGSESGAQIGGNLALPGAGQGRRRRVHGLQWQGLCAHACRLGLKGEGLRLRVEGLGFRD